MLIMAKVKFQQNELTKRWIQSYRNLSRTLGLSQLKLQKDIGMNQSFISQILNNRVNFPPKYLEKYCRKYNVNIGSLNSGLKTLIRVQKRGRPALKALPRKGSKRSTRSGSIDKMLESLKDAFSRQQNGSLTNIVAANRILANVSSKLTSLQNDISDLQNALGTQPSPRRRGRRARN